MAKKWTFDEYLGEQLKRIAFVTGGKFNITDISNRLLDRSYLNKLYRKEKPTVYWNWDSFTDRMNRHVYRVVKALGGARQKVRNRWVYDLNPNLLLTKTNTRKPLTWFDHS
jgi:hypothetical protein